MVYDSEEMPSLKTNIKANTAVFRMASWVGDRLKEHPCGSVVVYGSRERPGPKTNIMNMTVFMMPS